MSQEKEEQRRTKPMEAPVPDEGTSVGPEYSDRDSLPPTSERPSLSLGPLRALGFAPKPEGAEPAHTPARLGGLLTLASLVVVVAALKVARPILVPFTVAVFLATLIAPMVVYLKKKGISPTFGVPLVLMMTLVFFGALTGVVATTMNSFIQAAPTYQERLMLVINEYSSDLEAMGVPVTTETVRSMVQPEAVVVFLGDTLSGVADLLSNTFLVLLMTVFVLFEALVLPDKIRSALGDPNVDMSQGIRVIGRLKAYVVVKTSTSLITGLLVGASLHLMGVDFALLWGLLAFLLNFIPNIGSIIAAVPAVLMALLQQGTAGAFWVAVLFLVVNLVIGSFIEPKVMGQRMNLSPLIVFISLVFWGWLWGGMGMLLSVPLTMAIRIMLDGNDATRPFAILMAGSTSIPHIDDPTSLEDPADEARSTRVWGILADTFGEGRDSGEKKD